MFDKSPSAANKRAFLTMLLLAGSLLFTFTLGSEKAMRFYWGLDYHVLQGQYYRLVTYMWAHANREHLVGNLVPLLVLGWATLRAYGTRNWLLIYMVAGILAGLACVEVAPYRNVIGASGAMMSLFGMAIAAGLRAKRMRGVPYLPASLVTLVMCITIMSGFGVPGVANLAHVVGAFVGFVLAMVMPIKAPPQQPPANPS
jgi:rhomboid protease GluP